MIAIAVCHNLCGSHMSDVHCQWHLYVLSFLLVWHQVGQMKPTITTVEMLLVSCWLWTPLLSAICLSDIDSVKLGLPAFLQACISDLP